MRKFPRVLLLIVFTAALVQSPAASPLRYDAGKVSTPIQRWTVEELVGLGQKMFWGGVEPSQSGAQLVLGTPESNPAVAKAVNEGAVRLPAGKNADQGYTLRSVGERVYIAARTDVGVMYGLYAFLENYGAYFQISGAFLPTPAPFALKPLDVSVSPVFKYRGIMPWDNFLCGSSGYNEEDWQELLRNATRMKLNKLDLHFYPGYVYYNEVWDGKPVPPLWPAQPADFAPQGKPGSKAFGDTKLFGVRNWEENKGDRITAAEASQAMLRRVIDYSHDRGWVTAAGFALMQPRGGDFVMTRRGAGKTSSIPDPLQEKNVELSLQRYRRLQEIYPNSDFYWMWQTEAGGGMFREVGEDPGAVEFRKKYAHWAGNPGWTGDIDYAYLFLQVANRLSPRERAKLATGGWSVEHLFPAIHKDYPKEVIFASLNNYIPENAVKWADYYKVAQDGRRSWMIAWWEFDGNQWFPQFRTYWHEKKYRKAAEYGVESVSLLGWKLSGIEHHVRYLADFAWNPELSGKEFYRQFVERTYGKAGLEPITAIYDRYEEWEARTPPANPGDDRPMLLGAGWCPMAMPDVPFVKEGLDSPKWKRTVTQATAIKKGQEQLLEEDRRSIAVFQSVLPQLPPTGQSWARLMINRLEFRVLYLQSVMALNQSLITYDEVANVGGIPEGAKQAKKQSALALKLAAKSIEKYAEDIRNRGDLGVIGQLNPQFYDVIARFDGQFSLDSLYLTLNWRELGMNVAHRSNLADSKCWPVRDGSSKTEAFTDDGKPALRIILSGDGKHASRFIRREPIDLSTEPLLDFYLRTTTKQPVALMFQVAGDPTWHRLDLIGKHRLFNQADFISPALGINNGRWQRVTWNLQKLVGEKLGAKSIENLILGTWETPAEPATLEFKNVCFGSFNQLDGLETGK